MSRPYQPAPWLTNPHLHTVWGRLFRRRLVLPFHRARWNTPDDDFVDLLRLDGTSPDHPILLLLHGLEGSPSSPYISGTLQYALRRGWHACALFFRTCGGEMNRRQRSYHSGETSDLDFVIRRLTLERPQRPIVLVGMSLGGNVLLKWLGEQGSLLPPQVRAATAVSTPFDLARSCRHIDQTAGRFYSRRFLRSLRRKALEKIARYPSIADADAVRRAESLWELDRKSVV